MTNIYDHLWSQEWQNVQVIGPLTHSRYRLMLAECPESLPTNSRIIDVGCGNGKFLTMLGDRYPDAILQGIEYSQQAREVTPEKLRDAILVGDVVELAPELSKDPYDLVICSEVLEHVLNPTAAIQAIASLVKPGGVVILTVPGGMKYWSKQDEVAGHYRRFEYEEFSKLIKQTGLTITKHYGWGRVFALIYDRLVSWIGPETVMQTKTSRLSQLTAKTLILLFRVDDLFCSPQGFQLVTKAVKP